MEPRNDDVLTCCLLNTERADLSACQSVEKLEDLRTGSQTACLLCECVAFEAAGIVCCVELETTTDHKADGSRHKQGAAPRRATCVTRAAKQTQSGHL